MRTRARRSSAGRTLRLKGGAVGAQADLTADPIRGLQETLARMKQVAAGGVPAPVPQAPAPEALAVDPVAAPPALQPIVMPGPLPEMHIDNIAKMDNWDHRECSVANKAEWKTFMSAFLAQNPGIGEHIPKKIHQIWIGPKQPPIVWIDTWRKQYRAQHPGWEYKLWTDAEVAELPMRMKDLYDKEAMYQCKADLLRLEVLWREGGIYIDADMVWLSKSLQDVVSLSIHIDIYIDVCVCMYVCVCVCVCIYPSIYIDIDMIYI